MPKAISSSAGTAREEAEKDGVISGSGAGGEGVCPGMASIIVGIPTIIEVPPAKWTLPAGFLSATFQRRAAHQCIRVRADGAFPGQGPNVRIPREMNTHSTST